MTVLLASVVVGLLLVTTALLAAAETVVERLSLVRAFRLEEDGHAGGAALAWLLEHRTTTRNAVLVATVASRLLFAAGVLWIVQARPLPVQALVLVGAAVVSVVVGEVAPRTLALRRLEWWGLTLARPARLLVRVVTPVVRVLVDLGRALVGTRRDVPGPYPTDDQVAELLAAEDDEDAELHADERAMITSILELGDTVTREIMVPRPDMVTVEADAELRDVIATIVDHGRSRLPVRRGGEEIVGVVNAKDVLARLAQRPGSGRWDDLVRDAHFVPETKRVDRLLTDMREAAIHQAIVVDEYGAVTGLVTIEDVLEEIVGEIVDEHDDEAPMVEVVGRGTYRVDARLAVQDLAELLDVDLPHDEWDTVGGLVFGTLGRVPAEGEDVDLQGVRFTAERVQGRRVARVLVARLPEDEQVEEATT